MKVKKTYISAAIALALLGTTACGGGSGSSSSSSSSNTLNTTNKSATINLQAIDGYLENATVCVDLNANSICDDEDIQTSAKTDSKGKIQLIAEGNKLEQFNKNPSAKVLVVAKAGETLNVALDGTKKLLEKDINLSRTVFPKDFESNDGKVRNITPYTTLADKIGKAFTSEDDYTKDALSEIATSLGTTLDAIESDFNDPEKAKQNKDVIAALLASELLVAENKIEQQIENLDNFLESEEIIAIKTITEDKSQELALKEEIKDISDTIIDIVEEAEKNNNQNSNNDGTVHRPKNRAPVASFKVEKNGLTVETINESYDEDSVYGDEIASYTWTVKNDDNTIYTSNDLNWNNEFSEPGLYQITLKVTDRNGASNEYSLDPIYLDYPEADANFTCNQNDPVEVYDGNNRYYLSHYICEAMESSTYEYLWSSNSYGATCKSTSELEPWKYECLFYNNNLHNIGLIVIDKKGNTALDSVEFTTNDTFIAKFTDDNQAYSVEDAFELEPIDNCKSIEWCMKNPSLNASFADLSVLPSKGSYTYTWSYGNGDYDVKEVNGNLDENHEYHYFYPTKYTQTLTIKDNKTNRETTYTTENSYFDSLYNDKAGLIYHINYPAEKNTFKTFFIFNRSNGNYLLQDNNEDLELVKSIYIRNKEYDVYETTKSYSTNKDENGQYYVQIMESGEQDNEISKYYYNVAKNLYTDTIQVGDLVMFGTNMVYKKEPTSQSDGSTPDLLESSNSDTTKEIVQYEEPMIWEVMEITNGSSYSKYKDVKLAQVEPNQIERNLLFIDQNFVSSWSDTEGSIRNTLNKDFEEFGDNEKDAISIDIQSSSDKFSRLNFNKYESNLISPNKNINNYWSVTCDQDGKDCEYGLSKNIVNNTTDYLFFLSYDEVAERKIYGMASIYFGFYPKYIKHYYSNYLVRDLVKSYKGTKFGSTDQYFVYYWDHNTQFKYRLATKVKVPASQIKQYGW